MREEYCVNVDNEIQAEITTDQESDEVTPSNESNNTKWLKDLIHRYKRDNPLKKSDYIYRCQLKIEGRLDLPYRLTAWFIKDLSYDDTGESLFEDFTRQSQDLLEYFTYHGRPYDKEDLTRHLFLSGCTILMFIRCYTGNSLEILFGIGNGEARRIQEYLFRFDNQIPFGVVELLVNLSNDPNQLKKDIVEFIYINNMITKDLPIPSSNKSLLNQWNDILLIKNNKDVHLLHLLYLLITSSDGNIVSTNNNKRNHEDCSTILCSCFCRQKLNCNDPKGFFRNVEELTSTGIELEPSSSGLATISFSGKCFNLKGHLKLPPLIVDEWTERKLHNLLLYEKFLKKHYMLISYVKFMDILIDREQDVKELRAFRVLQNRLSSDADVAYLFNKLGSECSDPQDDFYRDVKIKIQHHCERKYAIWMTQVYQKYFSNPWAIIGLMAAVIVLSLAAVQAWFAVNPRK
uniref:Uncharacterized protein n=1 Tax=Cannabis sativa TaxID=3483 RepID=A0A803Q3W9_CANSA